MIIYSALITVMFLLSGVYKLQGFEETIKGFIVKTGFNKNVSTIAIIGAALLQIVGPLIIMHESHFKTGKYRKYARFACFSLAVFTVAATLIYHYPPIGKNYYPFISNLTTFGALLLLAKDFTTASDCTGFMCSYLT